MLNYYKSRKRLEYNNRTNLTKEESKPNIKCKKQNLSKKEERKNFY